MKLAHKITAVLAVSASTVLVAYGFITMRRERAMLQESATADARLTAKVMRRSFSKEYEAEGRVAAMRLLEYASASDGNPQFRSLTLSRLRSAEVRRESALDLKQIEQLEGGREVVVITDSPPQLLIYLPVEISGEPPMALLLQRSFSREQEHVALTRIHIAGATLTLILVMGGIAFFVGSKVVGQPMRALTEKAMRVGQGDLTGPVDLPQSDEIGQLAMTLNRMCADLEQETNRRLRTLEQLRHAERLSTVGQLASGIAHELGTPLNVVLGRAMLNASGNGSVDGVVENSRIIVEQTERMSGIIRQLLDFARRGAANKTTTDLRGLVRHLAQLLEPLANEAHVQFTVELSTDMASVHVDSNQVEQALTNLVVNAIQATPEGGEVRVQVDVTESHPPSGTAGDSPHVRVAVEDEGGGIEEEVRSRLFEPFFTTKEVGQGTGLGLPVAHGLIGDNDGWIQVESEVGSGSRFSVFLPLVEGIAA